MHNNSITEFGVCEALRTHGHAASTYVRVQLALEMVMLLFPACHPGLGWLQDCLVLAFGPSPSSLEAVILNIKGVFRHVSMGDGNVLRLGICT